MEKGEKKKKKGEFLRKGRRGREPNGGEEKI